MIGYWIIYVNKIVNAVDKELTTKMLKIQSLTLDDKELKLTDWMYKVRISMQDFAELLGVSRSYVYMLINGKRYPSEMLQEKIAYLSEGKVKRFTNCNP